ncbi:MAG: DNA cytosine methyltransferase [Myxococcaceae bacterium]
MRRRLTAVDLFAGAGGLTVGLKKAGFRVVAGIESDPIASQTYRANHPDVRLISEDIRGVAARPLTRLSALKGRQLDLLAGCPPCQGFSALRRLNGGRRVLDKQNDLVLEFARFVRALRPRAVMIENVPKLATDRRLYELRRALENLGYTFKINVVDAADFGVPQRRRRTIAIGIRSRKLAPSFPRKARVHPTVADALKDLPRVGRSGDELHDLAEHRSPKVEKLIAAIPKNGGSRSSLPKNRQLKCHRRTDGFFDVYGRMSWDDVAPTITSGCTNPSKGRFLHPSANRAITLREAALLQTFPRRYRFDMSKGKERAALMVGNALPPELIRRVGLALARTLKRLQEIE